MKTHAHLLDREQSVLLVIDLQESYRGKLANEPRVVASAAKLLDAAGVLGIPIVLTEQYPKGLGPTREEISSHLPPGVAKFEKTSFSCLGAPGLRAHLDQLARPQIVIVGIETHVCVNQTVHELLAARWQPHLVRDAVTARFALEDEAGFAKMTAAGALPASVESVVFEWLRDARSPDFKAVHKLVV